MAYLQKLERERQLRSLIGARRKKAPQKRGRGPRFDQLEPAAKLELERYAKQAGKHWRSDLIADCLRGGTRRRARFADVLCPLIKRYGPTWMRRELRVPWEVRRGR